MELEITKKDLELLINHAKKEQPFESVAFLLGVRNEERYSVKLVMPLKNTLRSTTEFHVDPGELYGVYREAERLKLEVVGIFHSHPAPPYPSAIDVRYMKLNPVVWLIASSMDWSVRAFMLKDGLIEVNLKIIEKIY